ncbi:unnamed protein product [Arctia plantaginis]|uniref:Kazal-like domain-containing protein n=1 Tax=Arctia plantaginis TaxID=874455 RepID=A0A8S0YVF6_ARCPL|nr:unnamed protein product [Arctia plantaginis]CAB3247828.1 unnamed protein product [Arctia plantaginis]
MIYIGADTFVFLLVFLEIKFLDAQVADKGGNQGDEITSVDSRFFDRGGRGHPNLRKPGRNGYPPSNYPGNSFFPNGNQNGNMQRPQPDFGWRPDGQYSNPGRPYQEPVRYPERYPANRPDNYPDSYPDYQGDTRYPSSNNVRPDDYDRNFRPGFNNMHENPNYQRPPYDNIPADRTEYPGYTDRPYSNGGRPFHQDDYTKPPGTPEDSRRPARYPLHNGRYPPQDIQGNPNQRPDGSSSDFRPDYPDDILNSHIQFPGNNIRPNQYAPNNNHQSNYPDNSNGNQFPYQGDINQDQGNYRPGANEVFQGNFNGLPPTRPQLPNNRPIDSINGPNTNDSADIPGKPVFVPSSNSPIGQVMFDGSTETPSQKQCEQTCPTTSEYNRVCGTNSVTYGNPGRFDCARNCGVAVSVLRKGTCPNDILLH